VSDSEPHRRASNPLCILRGVIDAHQDLTHEQSQPLNP